MKSNQKKSTSTGMMLLLFVLINVVILKQAYTINEMWYWALIFTFPPFIAAAVYHKRREKVYSKSL